MNSSNPHEPINIFSKHRFFLDVATSVSIVTLNYLPLIRRYVFADERDAYFLPKYGAQDYLAGLIVIMGLSLFCLMAIRMARLYANPVLNLFASFFIFIAIINPLNFVRLSLSKIKVGDVLSLIFSSSLIVKAMVGILILVAVLIFIRFYWHVFRALRIVFVITSPFAVLVILQLTWASVTSLAQDDGAAESSALNADADAPVGGAAMSAEATRMLVIVFDEVDYRLAFSERPDFLILPELDRFSRQAIVFTNAPALAVATMKAIPALLVGKRVNGAKIIEGSLVLNIEASEGGRSLTSMPNLFSEARISGQTLSILGYYHPYCRLFRGLYAECMRASYNLEDERGVTGNFWRRLEAALMYGSPLAKRTAAVRNHGIVLQRAKEMVRRFDVNLIFLHLQVPHAPFIYDASTRSMTYFNFSLMGYFDNLVLMDNFLGEIRRTMEGAGLWEGTAVLITSDHPWREATKYDGKKDRRVPILLKMPDQKDAVTYEKEFSPEHVKDLVLAILAKTLIKPDSVLAWVEKRQ